MLTAASVRAAAVEADYKYFRFDATSGGKSDMLLTGGPDPGGNCPPAPPISIGVLGPFDAPILFPCPRRQH
jgi:hypothetical protein